MRHSLPALLMGIAAFFSVSSNAQDALQLGDLDNLLLTEVVVTPTSDEYIEIHNAGPATVTLTNYYLSDDEDYALTPGLTGAGPMPDIADSDFIARFPNGATIDPGETQVIAFDGLGFQNSFKMIADYEILGTDGATPDMIDVVIGASAGLTNSGENIVLFYWDGASDLVADMDMLNVGTPSSTNDIGDKSAISVDGPDGNTDTSSYLADAATMPQQAADPGFGFSTKRLTTTEIGETQTGGNGRYGSDETTEDISQSWDTMFTAPDPGVFAGGGPSLPEVFINEVDVDTAGTDTMEFVELFGAANMSLDGLVLVLYNGSGDTSYFALDLDGQSLDANGFFVAGNAGITAADVNFPDNTLQNGADAVALYLGDDTDFPNNTSVTDTNLIDALVYDTNDSDDTGLIDVLTPGAPQLNEDENGDKDNQSIARSPDGGTLLDTTEFVVQAPTPGASNVAPAGIEVFINEVDADTAGTDELEFVELFGAPNLALDGLVLVFYNGSSDTSYAAYDLDGQTLDANGFFVIGNVGVANVTITFPSNGLQNGADAVALYEADDTDFPNGTAVTNTDLIDALVYDTNDADDTGLIDVLLGPGSPQLNEDENGDKDNESIARVPDGGTLLDASEFVVQAPTPGESNVASAGTDVFINEVDADTAGTDTMEFVELFGPANAALDGLVLVLYNGSSDTSYFALDLDGFTLDANGFFVVGNTAVANVGSVIPDNTLQNGADAVALYTGDATDFPNGTAVTDVNIIDALVYDTNDALDIGLIDGLFGDEVMQINEDENGDKDNEAIARVPDGGTPLTPSEFMVQAPTPGASNVGSAAVSIADVQGNGMTSPLEGMMVTVEDAIVTALAPDGFFIQDPTPDADADTSDGVFVFTDAAPTVSVGDDVRVSGTVEEFFDATQISGSPTVDILSSGNTVPDPVVLDAMLPSSTQPVDPLQFERLEGVLVTIANGIVTGPNQAFGSDPIAEFHITANGNRAFREPGVEYPGLKGLPVWDGNPEVFELDPNRLGLDNIRVVAGTTFSATGVIGYEFGDYELFPSELNLGTPPTAAPVRDRAGDEVTVGSLNLFRLFDEEGDYAVRLEKFSRYIREQLKAPDFLAVQEANGLQELQDLAAEISSDDASITYTAGLLESNDFSDIFNGYLVRSNVTVNNAELIQADETFEFDNSTFTLHDRAPLVVDVTFNNGARRGAGGFDMTVIVIHNRSLGGIDDAMDGPFVRFKRDLQATRIAEEIQARQTADEDLKMMLVGDFNGFEFTDGYVDVLGQITGDLDPLGALIEGTDVVNPDLINLVENLPAEERYSFINFGSAQVLDHALITQNLDCNVTEMAYGRGNADFARNYSEDASTALRASDHDGFVVFIEPVNVELVVSETTLNTIEGGSDQTFTVALSAEPTADVTVPVNSNDVTEGTVSPASLTFTAANWDTPQTVTLTPVDDAVADGNIAYTVTVGPSTSTDACAEGLTQDIDVTNQDNDMVGILVDPLILTVDESGTTGVFTVSLGTEPTDDVDFNLTSSDEGEVTISPASFTLNAGTMMQEVTVTGVADNAVDGDQMVDIDIPAPTSNDGTYAAIDPSDVVVTNQDIDSSDDAAINAIPGQFITVTGAPNTTVGIYVFNRATGEWEFLENVTLDANGEGTSNTIAQTDTTYGVGGIDGTQDPSIIIVNTVPTLGEWGLILFMIMMAAAAMVLNRRNREAAV